MAEFAPVAPPAILRGLKAFGSLGYYHLLLAHDIAANPEQYKDVFDDAVMSRKPFIILDNSLIELGYPAPAEMILEAAKIVKPSVVVLRDYLEDTAATIDASLESMNELLELDPKLQFMAVLQGRTRDEIFVCADVMARYESITAFGIPRVMTGRLGTRYKIALELYKAYSDHDYHLLGFSDDILDDVRSARLPFIAGIDSAVPLRMGYEGKRLSLLSSNHSPRGKFWEIGVTTPLMVQNLNAARHWITP